MTTLSYNLQLSIPHAHAAGQACIDCTGKVGYELSACNDANNGCVGGATGAGCDPLEKGCITIGKPENLPDKIQDIGGIVSTIVGAAILISAILAFVYLIWGGIQWITSGGDKQGLESARNRITSAIIGLVIVGAAWGIFKIIETVFGFHTILGT